LWIDLFGLGWDLAVGFIEGSNKPSINADNFLIAVNLSASHKGICSMELKSKFVRVL
jgi:hypothetical protein